MDHTRRYSDDEVAEILDRATADSPGSGPAPAQKAHGLTLQELQDIGREVGIPADRITQAAAALVPVSTVPLQRKKFLGATIGVGRTIELSRALDETEWARLVVDLRETFDARGKTRSEGLFRQWTNGNLQALLEPTDTGERLRLVTTKGSAVSAMTGAGIFSAMAVVLIVAAVATGGLDSDRLERLLLVVGMAIAALGASRFGLSGWALTRESQMDGIAARLTARLAAADHEATRMVGDGDDTP